MKKLKFASTINSLKQSGQAFHKSPSIKFPNQKNPSLDIYREEDEEGTPLKFHEIPDKENSKPTSESIETESISLSDFEEKCPPGGEDSVIFYTTSLRGIRKTFEDCNTIRFLLESFRISFQERDVSLHMEFRDELWRLLRGRAIPPKLFIKGRFIGGADEVVTLHEQGKLKTILEGIEVLSLNSAACNGCGNIRFVVCLNCNGSCKVFKDGDSEEIFIRCSECNENGLVKCPICC
ncbi:hypothetical protein Pint_36197 [Pistacia integerrima]|uniref:Uncharacterized protein n=1 Tax=Pistacia integerrima TaxID=434235 RepID=A0ACC0Y379_9ROSI|nr:hypothetical protein Pint_36197 [Pistacia integerrima]